MKMVFFVFFLRLLFAERGKRGRRVSVLLDQPGPQSPGGRILRADEAASVKGAEYGHCGEGQPFLGLLSSTTVR